MPAVPVALAIRAGWDPSVAWVPLGPCYAPLEACAPRLGNRVDRFVERRDCLICGRPGRSVYRRDFAHEDVAAFLRSRAYPEGFFDETGEACFELLHCNSCVFLWQAHVLAPEFEKSLYD